MPSLGPFQPCDVSSQFSPSTSLSQGCSFSHSAFVPKFCGPVRRRNSEIATSLKLCPFSWPTRNGGDFRSVSLGHTNEKRKKKKKKIGMVMYP